MPDRSRRALLGLLPGLAVVAACTSGPIRGPGAPFVPGEWVYWTDDPAALLKGLPPGAQEQVVQAWQALTPAQVTSVQRAWQRYDGYSQARIGVAWANLTGEQRVAAISSMRQRVDAGTLAATLPAQAVPSDLEQAAAAREPELPDLGRFGGDHARDGIWER